MTLSGTICGNGMATPRSHRRKATDQASVQPISLKEPASGGIREEPEGIVPLAGDSSSNDLQIFHQLPNLQRPNNELTKSNQYD